MLVGVNTIEGNRSLTRRGDIPRPPFETFRLALGTAPSEEPSIRCGVRVTTFRQDDRR